MSIGQDNLLDQIFSPIMSRLRIKTQQVFNPQDKGCNSLAYIDAYLSSDHTIKESSPGGIYQVVKKGRNVFLCGFYEQVIMNQK